MGSDIRGRDKSKSASASTPKAGRRTDYIKPENHASRFSRQRIDKRTKLLLYDLKADVRSKDDKQQCVFDVTTSLQNEERSTPGGENTECKLGYVLDREKFTISVIAPNTAKETTTAAVVIPVISPTGEEVRQVSKTRIEIDKPRGTVVVESSVPLAIGATPNGRVFNMVPGMEAVPIVAQLPSGHATAIRCEIAVI